MSLAESLRQNSSLLRTQYVEAKIETLVTASSDLTIGLDLPIAEMPTLAHEAVSDAYKEMISLGDYEVSQPYSSREMLYDESGNLLTPSEYAGYFIAGSTAAGTYILGRTH